MVDVTVPLKVRVGLSPIVTETASAQSDILTVPLRVTLGMKPRAMISAQPAPAGLTQWPIQRQGHLMPALSAAQPAYREGNPATAGEYAVNRGTVGRLECYVNGQRVTFLRDVPAQFDDFSSSVPFSSESATIRLPQMKPWDNPGTGDLAFLDASTDPAVEIVLVRDDNSVNHLWEGFLASGSDSSGPGREDYTFQAEGVFAQAVHTMHDPPLYLEPTDVGWIVADDLNSVPHRRWNKIARFTTGILTVDRGDQGQSVWQRVQSLLAKCWTADGKQLTLGRTGPYAFALGWKVPLSTVHYTVTKGAPGVEVELTEDQSQRDDAVYARGVDEDGGVWENRFFPGLDFGVPPTYPMASAGTDISVGTTDAGTATKSGVTQWQRKMRELGFPITIDGVMNANDLQWVRAIQRRRGISGGQLGPQTWAATWENNSTKVDTSSIRLPMARLDTAAPFLYAANGAEAGANPADDKRKIIHAMPEVNFGAGISKSAAIEPCQQILARDSIVGPAGRITLRTDPHETGSSRFDIEPGRNIHVLGHRGGVTLQISDVSHSEESTQLTVDSRSRDALTVEAILERDRDARRELSSRRGRNTDQANLNKSSVVLYEGDSQAGTLSRTAVNGNVGLWTIRKVFVSQVGVAKVEFSATSPKAEFIVALFGRPITPNQVAAFVPDPLSSKDGWYDNVDALKEKFGLLEIYGEPACPGGYSPWQKSDGKGLTGKLVDGSGPLYQSKYGGFLWVALFASKSTWIDGRLFPAVPT